MHDESMMMFNIELNAEVLEPFIIKFLVVVNDDDPSMAEPTNEGFPYKLSILSSMIWAISLITIHLVK